MAACRCPAHALNEQQHKQFAGFIKRFKRKFDAEGFSVEAFKELHEMTSSWITRHILPGVRHPPHRNRTVRRDFLKSHFV